MKTEKRNRVLRLMAAVVVAGLIGSQVVNTSSTAFAEGSYVDAGNYSDKPNALLDQAKTTVIALGAIGALNYLITQFPPVTPPPPAPPPAPSANPQNDPANAQPETDTL